MPVLAAITVVCLLMGPTVSTAQTECSPENDWIATDWKVRCKPDALAALDEAECDDTNPAGVAAVTRSELAAASSWLRALGFCPPVVGMPVRRDKPNYPAWVSDAATGGDLGVYQDRTLYVSSDYYFVLAGDEATHKQEVQSTGTMVHELFHAIQESYESRNAEDWVVEGTAEAVSLAWLKRTTTGGLSGYPRYFDDPLHKPRNEDHAYGNSIFWLWLGRHLGDESEIGYLSDALAEGRYTGAGGGVEDLEEYLRGRGQGLDAKSKTLWRVYPRFIAERAYIEAMYSDVKNVPIEYDEPQVEEKLERTVKGLAADPVKVTVNVPPDKLAELEILIRPDHEDLHLVVDTQSYSSPPMMPDKQAAFRPAARDPVWQAQRNRFTTQVRGRAEPHEFFVRTANVAMEPSASQQHSYTLELILSSQTCRYEVNLSGGFGGRSQGPSNYVLKEQEGELVIGFDGAFVPGNKGDRISGGVVTAPWTDKPGVFAITEASMVNHGVGGMAWLRQGMSGVPCPSCGGTLVIEELGKDIMTGSFQVTMPTMSPPPSPGEKAPPTRAFGTFQAMRHVNGEPFDPYSRCIREWGG